MAHWTAKITNGLQRVNHAAVLLGQRIYSFGGYCKENQDHHMEEWIDISCLDTVTKRWMVIHHMNDTEDVPEEDKPIREHPVPFRRYGHTAVEYKGKAYLFGGYNLKHKSTSTIHEFDPYTITWRKLQVNGTVPPGRDGHTAVVIDSKMIVFGGFEESNERYSQETYVFDFETCTWSQMRYAINPANDLPSEAPSARDYHTAVVFDKKMYVFGGRVNSTGFIDNNTDPDDEIYDNNLWVLDIENRKWTKQKVSGDIPVGKRSHSAWVHNGFMYIFGGYLGLTKTHFNDVHRYDFAKSTWATVEPRGNRPSERRRQCCIVVRNCVYVFGGSTPILTTRKYGVLREKMVDASDLHILDYAPSLQTLAMMAVIKNVEQSVIDNDFEELAEFIPRDLRMELCCFTQRNSLLQDIPRHNHAGLQQRVFPARIEH